jgi:hypothetical protein
VNRNQAQLNAVIDCLQQAQSLSYDNLLISASLPFIKQNVDKLVRWEELNYRTSPNGHGKSLQNKSEWQKIKGRSRMRRIDREKWLLNG